MLDKLKHIFLKDSTVVVVGVFLEKEKVSYNALKLSNKKENLTIVDKFAFNSFEDLNDKLDKKYPIILAFSGTGILNKKLKITPDYKSKILLNVNINDFYFYERHQENEAYVSVVRKDTITKQLELFSLSNFLVIDYSIGPFVASLLSYVTESDKIIANSTELSVIDKNLLDFKKTTENKILAIGNQAVSEKETTLLGSAINYFYPIDTFTYENDFLNNNKEEANFKRYFEILGATLLGIFFGLLLISYLLLGHYNDKIVSVNSNIKSVQETYNIIKDLQKDRDNKKEILNESGVFTARFLAFYVNELTVEIPKSITLNRFSLFPYDRKIKPLEKIKFEENCIIIEGESSSNIIFNDWYKGLKKIDWISKSDIITYKANRNNNYDFEIKLKIR